MKALARNLAVVAFITGSVAVLAYYSETISRPPVVSIAEPYVTVEPEKSAKILKAESRFQHCLQQADQNRATAWELSCEQVFPETAAKFNACVTRIALKGKASTAAQACQTKCVLPETISGALDLKRDQAKAQCRTQMQAAERG